MTPSREKGTAKKEYTTLLATTYRSCIFFLSLIFTLGSLGFHSGMSGTRSADEPNGGGAFPALFLFFFFPGPSFSFSLSPLLAR